MKLNYSFFSIIFLLCFPLMIACGAPRLVPADGDDPGTTAPASSYAKLKADVLELINEHRKEKGLPALKENNFIESVADGHSTNMASKRVAFGHDGFEDRYKELQKGIKGMRSMAENV